MLNVLIVGSGGFVGASLRYLVGLAAAKTVPVPFTTILINIAGAFLIGLLYAVNQKHNFVSQQVYLFLTIGVLGGFTTFSTFSLKTINLISEKNFELAVINMVASPVLCVATAFFGKYILRG